MKAKTTIKKHTNFFDLKVNDYMEIKIEFKGYKTEFIKYIETLKKEL